MTNRDVATLTFRLVGAVTLFELLAWSPFVATYFLRNSDQTFGSLLVLGFVPALIPLILGIAFVTFPGTIADRVLGFDPAKDDAIAEPLLFQVCFATLGVYFFVSGLSNSGYEITSLVLVSGLVMPDDSPFNHFEQMSGLLSALVEVIAGAALVLGRHGIVAFVLRLRGRA